MKTMTINKQLLLVLTVCITTHTYTHNHKHTQRSKGLTTLCSSYGLSVVSGGLIGGITGVLSRGAIELVSEIIPPSQNNILLKVIALGAMFSILIEENKIRTALINELDESCEENNITLKKFLTTEVAWIASWLGFLIYTPHQTNQVKCHT
jgi:hypothetical protein